MSRGAQKTFEFSRSTQLSLRREVQLPQGEKFILWILDDHIGHGTSWKMTMTQLQEESGSSRSAVYNFVNRLNARGLIWWDDLPDGRRDFRICWPNVAEEIEAQTQSTSPPGGIAVHHVDSQSTTWTLSPSRGKPSPPDGLHIMNSAPLSALLSAPSTPTPDADQNPGEGDGPNCGPRKEEILRRLQGTGVGAFVGALDLAQANGLTLDQIAAVIEHYQAHPGRWPPKVLYARLTRPEAKFTAAAEGWYGENADWLARQRIHRQVHSQQAPAPRQEDPADAEERRRIEAEFGEQLDRMTPAELAGLFPQDSPARIAVAKHGVTSKLLRPSLLKALQQRKAGET